MALDTYSGLKSAIADHLDNADLDSQIDDFIDIAEAKHKREVRIREMLKRATITIDDRFLTIPADFLQPKTLRIFTGLTSGCRYYPDVTEVTVHEITTQSIADIRRPKYYAVHESIEFDTAIDPSDAYSGELIYYFPLTALSDSNTTNAILTRAPDVYLYGALISTAPFLMFDERIPVWEKLYKTAVNDLNQLDFKRSGPLIARVVGSTP